MKKQTNKIPQIVLITKTATQNQGNQALSIAWRDFLSERYPDANVRLLERAPSYLKRFTVSTLRTTDKPLDAFDAMAKSLLLKRAMNIEKDPSRWDVSHDPNQTQVLHFLKLRQALRLRSRLAAFDFGAKEYYNRLAYLCESDMVVLNPAGEFQRNATDTALHYLLEARCAQLSGIPTAFVNLSFELDDKLLIELSEYVFSKCKVLEFRDNESVSHLSAHGGVSNPVVYPDAAIMTKIKRSEIRFGKGIALAINALQLRDNELSTGWDTVFDKLRVSGPITLTSNEWTTDYPFWKKYLSINGVNCHGETLDCFDYARSLAQYDIVVSSRLHTCVLGLVAGAAVIPVETGTFKLSGFFNQIGMMDEPIRMGEEDWQLKLLDKIHQVSTSPSKRVEFQDTFIEAARTSWKKGMNAVFSSDLLMRR